MPDPHGDCRTCQIVAGHTRDAEVVYLGHVAVGYIPDPVLVAGHVTLVPREHSADLLTLDPDTAYALLRETRDYAAAHRDPLDAQSVTLIGTGRSTGPQADAHLSVHLLPR